MSVYVYVIGRQEGPVKVGISSQPYARLSALQTGCPFKLELLFAAKLATREHALEIEEAFHDVYRQHRLSGEWFNVDADQGIEGVETAIQIDEHFNSLECRQ